MPDILKVANAANIVVNGYAFTRKGNQIHVLNLNRPVSACVLSADGDVMETSMDDIEISIVQDYYTRNRDFMEDE